MPKMEVIKLIWDKHQRKVFKLLWDEENSKQQLVVVEININNNYNFNTNNNIIINYKYNNIIIYKIIVRGLLFLATRM